MPFRYSNYYLTVYNSKLILFSYSLTGCSDEACEVASLTKLLSFCTGSEYPSPLRFDNPITVCFGSNTVHSN